MLTLNLPPYPYKLKKDEAGQLFLWDRLRQQYMELTPEEWVRQHFVHYLITGKGVPPVLMRLEAELKYGSLTKWSDILVYNRLGNPLVMVECKAPTVNISGDSLLQLSGYNYALSVPYLVLTNGLSHYYLWREASHFQWLSELPVFEALNSS